MPSEAMTPKRRMETLLAGGIPDVPPHWELVFQIPDTLFGIDLAAAMAKGKRDGLDCYAEVAWRLIEECGYAAVPGLDAYEPEDVRHLRERIGEKALVPGYDHEGVFWMLPGSEMEEFALRLFEDSEGLHAEARAKCDRSKERIRRLVDAGADFFMLTYDFGYNQAPFVSPKHFDQICAPYMTEIVALIHDLGRKAILHSDGCLNQILDSIVGTGIDGYQSVDPQGQMDIREVRRRFPDLLLMGNVPCSLLQDRDDEKIHAAVWECMEHGGVGKRYVFSTSNCIFAGMPPESYRQMLAEYRAYLKMLGGC